MDFIDVAIIGGGPAGLTAASMVARQVHTAVVYDSGSYRNADVPHFHMVLTWDHENPEEYRRAARENITRHYFTHIQFADIPVVEISKKSDAHFEVRGANLEVKSFRKVILAVGSSNIFPPIQGYDKCWKRRIFHCLFCHGYEDQGGGSSGVLAVDPVGSALAVHMAMNAAQLTDKVTLYTNGNEAMAVEIKASNLVASKFSIETRKIKQLIASGGWGPGPGDPTLEQNPGSVTVKFEDGTSKYERFLVHNPTTVAQGPFVKQLGLETTSSGDIKADYPFWQTSVPGVYAVGDCSTPYKVTPSAITSGCNAAVAVCAEIQAAKYIQQEAHSASS